MTAFAPVPLHLCISQLVFYLCVYFNVFQMAGDISTTVSASTSFNSRAKGKKTKTPGKGFDWSDSDHVPVPLAGGHSTAIESPSRTVKTGEGAASLQNRRLGYQNKEAKDSS